MKAVISKVFHLFHANRLYTDKFKLLLVIRQSEAQCIDRFKVYTFHYHFNDFILVITTFGSAHFDSSAYFFSFIAFVYTIFQLSGYYRDIISVNQIILVDITIADVTFKVAVAFAQTGVVGIRSQVVVVNLTVIVDVAWQVTFSSGNFEYIQFTTGTIIANTFCYRKFDVTCSRTFCECKYFHLILAVPFKCTGFSPVFFVHTI